MLPMVDGAPDFNLFDSGISSPDTIYSIAPAAKLKQIDIISFDIPPIIFPISSNLFDHSK